MPVSASPILSASLVFLTVALVSCGGGGDSSPGTKAGGASSDARLAGGAVGVGGGGGQAGAIGTGSGTITTGGNGVATGGAFGTGGARGDAAVVGTGGIERDGGGVAALGGRGGVGPGTGGGAGSGARVDAGLGGSGSGGAIAAGGGGSGAGGSTAVMPAGVTAMFPEPGATGVCPDPPLRLTFAAPPTLGTTGKIQVWNASGTAVASVDMAASTVTDTIGGTSFVLLRPVFVDENAVVIYLKTKALAYGQTYYVTVDAGAIKPSSGSFSITGSSAWRFTTAAAVPTNLSALTVALDGSGPFCTVQGAADALPANNTAASVISIRNGIYHEIMRVSKKSNITLHGEDRAKTQIVGTNNNTQQGSGAGTSNRFLLGFDNLSGLVIENLTIKNLTPQGGSQAEALRLASCDKCLVRDTDIWSLQDTLLWEGRIYAENCLIVGNVDYVWGRGVVYFNKCEFRTVGRTGVIVQSRNAAGAYGYVFVDCKLTADSAAKNNMLARIDVSAYPGSHVAYINCQMTNIGSAGWTITGGSATSSLRFWEYQSTDASGKALDTSGRASGSTQISASQAASMRDVAEVLGGWKP